MTTQLIDPQAAAHLPRKENGANTARNAQPLWLNAKARAIAEGKDNE